VQSFIQQHAGKITGVLGCFDRLIFKGHLPLSYPQGMENLLDHHGILRKNFKHFAPAQAQILKEHAWALAKETNRPYQYLKGPCRKDDLARAIARQDGVTQGLVAVFGVNELCPSFALRTGPSRPRLVAERRPCLCLYFYYLDPQFGLIHVRLQTWFPMTIQVYINGHEWLARQLDKAKVGYQLQDNAFRALDDAAKAQKISDRLLKLHWPRILDAFAKRVNPLLKDLFQGLHYNWVIDQAEYATDILFQDQASLQTLYARLLDHAILHFGAPEVLTFLGKKLRGNFQGEVLTDCVKKRCPGARIKHRVGGNWLKMYDKFAQVLRIEVVINRPYMFRVLRWGTRQGQRVFGWYPLAKKVAYLRRYAQIGRQAAGRYLDALAVVHDPEVGQRLLDQACHRATFQGRPRRALNPLSHAEQQLFQAVLHGDQALQGFANRDIAQRLNIVFSQDPAGHRRQSAKISRLLQLLRAHGFIKKLPRSRRYRATDKGYAFMSTVITLRQRSFPAEFSEAA
jgi:hypothetical protein